MTDPGRTIASRARGARRRDMIRRAVRHTWIALLLGSLAGCQGRAQAQAVPSPRPAAPAPVLVDTAAPAGEAEATVVREPPLDAATPPHPTPDAGRPPEIEVLRMRLQAALAALVESRRRLFRQTAEEGRQQLLVDWLNDPWAVTRELALDLADQHLTANHPFDEPLRAALRAHLADGRPGLQRRATLLLWRLADEPAADVVTERVGAAADGHVEVRRAQLLLLTGLPRASTVEPILRMLQDPALRGPAAAALAAAIDHDLLDATQRFRAAGYIRADLPDAALPEPQVISLLARVGTPADWRRIAGWLDADDEKVKAAAARAWAESKQPLWELARRADDPSIQRILFAAARQRGRDVRTMLALVRHPPSDDQNLVPWRRALLEMAARVPEADLLLVEPELAAEGGHAELREQLLSIGISRVLDRTSLAENHLENGSGAEAGVVPEPEASDLATLADLLLGRAAILVTLGEPGAAIGDYEQVLKLSGVPDHPPRDARLARGLLEAHVAARDIGKAGQQASAMLAGADPSRRPDVVQLIGTCYLDGVARDLAAEQMKEARQLAEALVAILGRDLPEPLATRLEEVQSRLEKSPAPDDRPASTRPGARAP